MLVLTLRDARQKMSRSRPWTFRLEYHAVNAHKFYLICTGRGRNEPVEVYYGRVGNRPTILVKSWDYVEKTVPAKEAKGYHYVKTGFVRVRQATLDAFSPAPTPSGSPFRPPHKQAPGPSATLSPQLPPKPASPPSGPYAQIVTVAPTGAGVWHALNSSGGKVLTLSKDGVRDLMAQYPNIQVAGL